MQYKIEDIIYLVNKDKTSYLHLREYMPNNFYSYHIEAGVYLSTPPYQKKNTFLITDVDFFVVEKEYHQNEIKDILNIVWERTERKLSCLDIPFDRLLLNK